MARQILNVSIAGVAVLLVTALSSSIGFAATASNAQSPLGMNLQNVNYYTQEQPFMNIFKTAGPSRANPHGWYTHRSDSGPFDTNEEAYLQLDANGYPTTLSPAGGDAASAPFTSVGVLLLYTLGKSNAGTGEYYPAGQYLVLYDGQGTLDYRNDAKLVSSAAGRDVINIATPTQGGGIDLRITSTDPNHTGNYLRNIRVVKAEQESLLTAGGVFNPTFISLLQNFRLLRGMQWLEIDSAGGTLVNWADRPQLADAGWGGPNGTPIEALLQLCNASGADCWLNVPHTATNDYITQMATLAHSLLTTNEKAYVEFSNEVWNTVFAQNAYAAAQGKLMWPSAGSGADYILNWYGMRASQTCDIWKSVWGQDAGRVVCVMGAQAANTWTATEALNCVLWTGAGNAPCSGHKFGAVAIAPYFANLQAQSSWTLDTLFQTISGGDIQTTAGWSAAYKQTLAPYGLPFIAYEGGQTLASISTGATEALYIAANRDPRMGTLYTTTLNNWKANGGELYTIYADIYQPSQWGEWGALESLWDTVTPLSSAPPKWQAIQNFIASNNCWWANCIGTTGGTPPAAVPAAPANLTVH